MRKQTVLAGARVVLPDGVIDDGWVEIDDGTIVAIGSGRVAGPASDLGGSWLLPGFIDLHMHGGGGYDVTRSADAMAGAVRFHRSRGTTKTLVSLMAQPIAALCTQLSWVAALSTAGLVLGAHLEGPFLSEARCGAQRPENLSLPDPLVLRTLVEAGQGFLRTVTVAPELPGALEVIGDLTAAGVVAALGHTNATYEQAEAGFAAGATLATHLFNAMGTFNHRAPGPSIAALDSAAYLEMINDGVHVHESLTRLVARAAADRLIFITDAISATGVGDGQYTLGDQSVVVADGQARLQHGHSLAGSTLTMDEAVRRAIKYVGLPIEVASAAASGNPARALGIDDEVGAIEIGKIADLVILDRALGVSAVLVAGDFS
ncbi:MAG: N-acetylglucosamine-6-phosphate deacetylase [Frankiales bacterium]|nr:N-acetylglucosamine-6-phosphate deacetylase [Frankiales bacterium]